CVFASRELVSIRAAQAGKRGAAEGIVSIRSCQVATRIREGKGAPQIVSQEAEGACGIRTAEDLVHAEAQQVGGDGGTGKLLHGIEPVIQKPCSRRVLCAPAKTVILQGVPVQRGQV